MTNSSILNCIDTYSKLGLKYKLEFTFSRGPFLVLVAALNPSPPEGFLQQGAKMRNTKNCFTQFLILIILCFNTYRGGQRTIYKQVCIYHLELTNVTIL